MQASYTESKRSHILLAAVLFFSFSAYAQTGTSTLISGTVTDPTGALVPNATVEIKNPVSGFSRTATTGASGNFSIPNVPFNPYHVTVTSQGFSAFVSDV
ncbi:MAG TPA: carboxypeptidase-like regulatory domain-containing protein, partial [Candidatus Sulfotelmatobacter sp.]|nr:carboxypeptidase-like regulatory domain-containing protein [Candidatus Sulfotelmatobacter sp.]